MNSVVIGIGSNINAAKNIDLALSDLTKLGQIMKRSQFIQTEPIGITNQAVFTNGAVLIRTELNQGDLNKQLKSIEDRLGRDRTRPKYGPREIDLDIIVFNNVIVDDDYHQRRFLKKVVDEVWL
ncbi:2-amino-4-hydroxy-6-hydroxymethyldihydropteridine diphosphokinase [Carboxylicivirga sp. N1Y90]|uniref:2-amino-4-hydroxy-6- hydroxymethyldihydropteridine diphosphokinase n=1 Tax=Carboxylicivirga fragile TaxID=3417571 RepID=UPI003D349E01